MKNRSQIQTLTVCAMLLAIQIILSRFLSISTPIVKIGFDFAPMALAGMLFGPVWGCAVGVLADFLGAQLFPIGAYFPGYTLVAGMCGATYGFLLHKKEGQEIGNKMMQLRTVAAILIVILPLQLGLDTLWLSMTMGQGYLALIPTRMIKTVVMLPVQYITIQVLAGMSTQLVRRVVRQA